MTSKRQHLDNFDQNLIFSSMNNWKAAAEKYDEAAQQDYKRIRSYLTLYQFRLNDDQKSEIREKLAECLDEISSNDFVHDLDTYLEGFCFKLDKSVLPTQPKEVKIEIAQKIDSAPQPIISAPKPTISAPPNTPVDSTQNFPELTLDTSDLDYYTLQFFQ